MLYQPSEQSTTELYQATLSEFALIKISGEDSFEFLQNQLSQDLRIVTSTQAQLATLSSAKGRVFANFLIWQDAEQDLPTYYACLQQDIAEQTQKRLSMFVLRAKVKVELASAKICGIWGSNHEAISQRLAIDGHHSSPTITTQTFTVNKNDDAFIIRYPSEGGHIRLLAISLEGQAPLCSDCQQSSENHWYAQDIALGLPWICAATKELFVAQSINQDVMHAINFTKGCYPGQEVIARSHYRGSLKRRSVIGFVTPAIQDAKSLLATDIMQGEDIVGQIVNAVSLNDKTYLLFEIQLDALNESANKDLTLSAEPAATIELMPLHYSLDKPEQA